MARTSRKKIVKAVNYKKETSGKFDLPNKEELFEPEKPAVKAFKKVSGRTPKQKDLIKSINAKDITFVSGVAGTGKTLISVGMAVEHLEKGKIEKIIITRPLITSEEDLGFLPGGMDEKTYPFLIPIYDSFREFVPNKQLEDWKKDGTVEICPLAYMRGRAQPLDADILTPTGYKKIGDLSVGDLVMDDNGTPTKITGIFPQGIKDVYKVTFSDGSTTECTEDHLWSTETRSEYKHKKGFSVKTLKQIKEKIKCAHANNHRIPLTKPVQFKKRSLIIDPYLLGVLLGDGSISVGSVTVSNVDKELIDNIKEKSKNQYTIKQIGNTNDYRFSKLPNSASSTIKKQLKQLGLYGLKSNNKFIPNDYLHSDIDDRLEILRGLMDTDGCIFKDKNNYRIQYYSTSKELAKNVQFLVESLGGTATIRKRDYTEKDQHQYKERTIRHNHSMYQLEINISINPFKISKKSNKFKPRTLNRFITKVEQVEQKECQCISVNNKSKLYLTNNFIVTHNTLKKAFIVADELQNATLSQLKMLVTRIGEDSKMVLNGDPTQSDLPFAQRGAFQCFCDRLVKHAEIGVIYLSNSDIQRHALLTKIIPDLDHIQQKDLIAAGQRTQLENERPARTLEETFSGYHNYNEYFDEEDDY